MRDVDTLIVGGGPAGSSCARELLLHNRECFVLDRKRMPRVKLCAGWITPKVLSDLEIDVETYPHGLVKLEQTRAFFGRSHRLSKTISSDQYSIRRVEFDHWLLQRSGAEVVEHTVHEIEQQNGAFIIDGKFRCRHLVGAGGTNCPVKKTFFDADRGKLVVAQEVEYETKPLSALCTLWFPYAGSFGYAWYVPKADAVNVGFGGLRSQLENWDRRGLWREFVDLLKTEGCISDEPPEPKGYSYYLGHRQKQVHHDNVYIVGDAAGLATVDLAEGIGPAVESGILAARAILAGGSYSTQSITKHSLSAASRFFRNCTAFIP